MAKPSSPCPWFLAVLPHRFPYMYYPDISHLSFKPDQYSLYPASFPGPCPELSRAGLLGHLGY